jgi:hypothetical protein
MHANYILSARHVPWSAASVVQFPGTTSGLWMHADVDCVLERDEHFPTGARQPRHVGMPCTVCNPHF